MAEVTKSAVTIKWKRERAMVMQVFKLTCCMTISTSAHCSKQKAIPLLQAYWQKQCGVCSDAWKNEVYKVLGQWIQLMTQVYAMASSGTSCCIISDI